MSIKINSYSSWMNTKKRSIGNLLFQEDSAVKIPENL